MLENITLSTRKESLLYSHLDRKKNINKIQLVKFWNLRFCNWRSSVDSKELTECRPDLVASCFQLGCIAYFVLDNSSYVRRETKMNLSFSGCGFMGIYHIGVASAIREYAPHLVAGKITGASAGALAACGLICNICLGQATSDVLKIVIQARAGALGPLRPSFNLVRILRQGLFKNLPPDAHKICTGRLHISLTRFSDGKNVLVSQFDTKEDLVQALICSMFIPFYCGAMPPTYKGERYIDGGWSDNLPSLDENTVTVSPFSGESDICPHDSESASFLSFDLRNTNVRFTTRNVYRIVTALFPPHPEIMSEMCRQGFEDALRFLASRDLLSCTRCIAIRSSIMLKSDRRASSEDTLISETDDETVLTGAVDEITANTTPATPSVGLIKRAKAVNVGKSKSAPRMRVRTAQSTSNVGRRTNGLSESHMYHSTETECESCRNAAKIAAGKGLPKIVRDTLASAEAGERTLFTRLLGLAPIRWLRYLTIPWLLPLDITYALCRKFLEWLPSLSDDARWLFERATEAVRFILSEIEAHKKLTARFSCQMAITELNYYNVLFGSNTTPRTTPATTSPSPSQQATPAPPSQSARRGSIVSESVVPPGQWTVAQGNLGFSVDLNARSHRVRELANIVHKDKPEYSKFSAARVAHVAESLGWEGLQKAASPHSGSMENVQQDGVDTFASILAFTRRQEALMAYYYLDEKNRMKVTEIYGLHQPAGSRPISRRQSMKDNRWRASKDDSGVSGVSASELEAALLAKVPGAAVGYKRQAHGQQQNDSNGAGVQRSASFPKHRRNTMMSGGVGGTNRAQLTTAALSNRSKTIAFVSPISTASESEETEKLFVPDRRRRRADSETEAAAYEPEDSSGDE